MTTCMHLEQHKTKKAPKEAVNIKLFLNLFYDSMEYRKPSYLLLMHNFKQTTALKNLS